MITYSSALASLLRTVFENGAAQHVQSGVTFRLVDETFKWNASGCDFMVYDDEGNRYRVAIESRGLHRSHC